MEVRLERIWGIAFLILMFTEQLPGQEILLHRRVPSVIQRNEEDGGEKSTPFIARTFCILSLLPIDQDAIFNLLPGASLSIQSENRIVYKQNKPIAIGYNLGVKWNMMALAQNVQQPLSGGAVHRSQILQQFALPLGMFVRWKISNGGGRIGTYIDFGSNGFWNFSNFLAQSDSPDPSVNLGARRVNSTFNRLTYINRLGYEFEIRIGRGLWGLHAIYRGNHLFKVSSSINNGALMPDLARWSAGVNMNFWKFKKTKKDEDEI